MLSYWHRKAWVVINNSPSMIPSEALNFILCPRESLCCLLSPDPPTALCCGLLPSTLVLEMVSTGAGLPVHPALYWLSFSCSLLDVSYGCLSVLSVPALWLWWGLNLSLAEQFRIRGAVEFPVLFRTGSVLRSFAVGMVRWLEREGMGWSCRLP